MPVTGSLFADGLEHSGASWEAVFKGLQPDKSERIDLFDLGVGVS